MRDFKFPLRCQRDLHTSVMLHGVDWYLFTDVSGQLTGPIFRCQLDCLILEDGTDRLSQNNQSTLYNIPEQRGSNVLKLHTCSPAGWHSLHTLNSLYRVITLCDRYFCHFQSARLLCYCKPQSTSHTHTPHTHARAHTHTPHTHTHTPHTHTYTTHIHTHTHTHTTHHTRAHTYTHTHHTHTAK